MSRDITDVQTSEPILVMAASTRKGSVNQALANQIGANLADRGASVGVIDLADYVMPLYHADDEITNGIPDEVRALAERVAAAQVLVIVSPEYNGTFTPLLKNTIDWLTRVDKAILADCTVLLASASPGGGGGQNGVAMVAQWMSNMRVSVADTTLSIPSAQVATNGTLAAIDDGELAAFAGQALDIVSDTKS